MLRFSLSPFVWALEKGGEGGAFSRWRYVESGREEEGRGLGPVGRGYTVIGGYYACMSRF